MNILVNGLLLNTNFTGVQYYTENIFASIAKYVNREFSISIILPNEYQGILNQQNEIEIIHPKLPFTNRIQRIVYENVCVPILLKRNQPTIFHSPSYLLPYINVCPSIVTVHDLIAVNYPEFSQYESVIYYKLFQSRAIKQSRKIIAVSDIVKRDIITTYNIPEEKIVTIYHGVSSLFQKEHNRAKLDMVRKKYRLPEKYILFVGNIEPKKNLENLTRAFHRLKMQTDVKHKLVIVGNNGWKYDAFYRTIQQLDMKDDIVFTGYVVLTDMPSVYSMADLFVFPSFYEGFGIPPLEAMACGIPILVSNTGALPEITNQVSIEINPFSIEEIAEGIYRGLTDINLRNHLIEKGALVKRYSWDKAAKETMKVYEEVHRTN